MYRNKEITPIILWKVLLIRALFCYWGDIMIKRYEELDSLRGIAALIVLISHILFVFSTIENEIKSNFSYLSPLWNGHSAVIMFFLLSGFVLSLPFEKNNKFSYPKYLIKRICRIYIPYILVLCSVLVIKIMLQSKIGTVPDLQQWALWTKDISIRRIIDHIFFLGEYDARCISYGNLVFGS